MWMNILYGMPKSSTQSVFTTHLKDRNNKITIIEGIQKSKRWPYWVFWVYIHTKIYSLPFNAAKSFVELQIGYRFYLKTISYINIDFCRLNDLLAYLKYTADILKHIRCDELFRNHQMMSTEIDELSIQKHHFSQKMLF